MRCMLMHKSVQVLEMELDEATGTIRSLGKVYDPLHVPIGAKVYKEGIDRYSLNDWWVSRAIPDERAGVRQALEALDVRNTRILMMRNHGFSLSDAYWIHPKGSSATWDTHNFFEHPFSEDVGDVLLGMNVGRPRDMHSPDVTTDGNLKKRWKIMAGKRCLLKGGSNPYRQQPLNEVIASGVMTRMGIEHVPYTVVWDHGVPYSVCEDFVTAETELIPAWRIYQTQKKANHVSVYQHFVNCAQALGIPGVIPFLDQMITLDYIIANEDRHFNNFGAVRNAQTLEWIGMAPIYDSGSSLGYDRIPSQIRHDEDTLCKPFKQTHTEQLKLVTDFSWLDLSRLSDVRSLIEQTLSVSEAQEYMDDRRITAIADAVEGRIQKLTDRTKGQIVHAQDDTTDDVTENRAKAYGT